MVSFCENLKNNSTGMGRKENRNESFVRLMVSVPIKITNLYY